MAVFSGINGSVATIGDESEPLRVYPTVLASKSQVTRWVLSSTRGPADVTPKAHAQFIGVPNHVEWVAVIQGYGVHPQLTANMTEWFNAFPLSLTLERVSGDSFGGLAWTESLVHEVIVDGPISWRARLRMIGAVTLA